MTIAEAIYQHSLRLPELVAREPLDFIEFLERRYAAAGTTPGLEPQDELARREALARLDGVRIPLGAASPSPTATSYPARSGAVDVFSTFADRIRGGN